MLLIIRERKVVVTTTDKIVVVGLCVYYQKLPRRVMTGALKTRIDVRGMVGDSILGRLVRPIVPGDPVFPGVERNPFFNYESP
jgi:hypothetical protein